MGEPAPNAGYNGMGNPPPTRVIMGWGNPPPTRVIMGAIVKVIKILRLP